MSESGNVSVRVHKRAKTVDEGLRLTKLKAGGHYIEDDTKHYQHVTTALGYGLIAAIRYHEDYGKRFGSMSRWAMTSF
jgi:hypothetical protein